MIATPCQRNRLMQKLKAETCIRRKNGTENERKGRNGLNNKGETLLWGLRPQAPGIYRFDANPSE
jgi:hypothetical protein